jgi:sortase (surface protein transpeptidase)
MMQRIGRIALPMLAAVMVFLAMTGGIGAGTLGSLGAAGFPGVSLGDDGSELKAGPLGLNRQAPNGEVPVAIQIPDAEVDAEVELNEIVDGVMQDPSGPWVVSWYQETAEVGADGNSVMSGHVDYWDVGPAVFRSVADLGPGAQISVTGTDGSVYTYEVEWVDTFAIAELTPETITDLVGPTDYSALTLITCGGDFDRAAGEYLSRTIVRARMVDSATSGEPSADEGQAAAFGVDVTVQPTANVNLRSEASIDGEVVTTLGPSDELTITGEPVEAGGIVWWPVETSDGTTGWVSQDYIEATG